MIEEAERTVAVRVGQGFGEDTQTERMPVQPSADLLTLRCRAADFQLAEQRGPLLRQQARQIELVKGRAEKHRGRRKRSGW